MEYPRCKKCGKISIKELCLTCNRKLKYKPQIDVKCSICGKTSTTTNEKWLKEPYKCMKCR